MLEAYVNIDITGIGIVTPARSLALALAEYRGKPTNPERLWNFQEAHWGLNRLAAGLAGSDVAIPGVPYSEAQLRQFRKSDHILFLPEVFSTKEGLRLLGRVYPKMGWEAHSIIREVNNVDRGVL